MGSRRAKTRSSRIKGDEHYQKKKQRNLIIIGSFIAALMVFSIFGVMLYNDDSQASQNSAQGFGFKAVQTDQGFQVYEITKTPRGKSAFKAQTFIFSPATLEVVEQTKVDLIMNGTKVYVTLDPVNYILANISNSSNLTAEQSAAVTDLQIRMYLQAEIAQILLAANIDAVSASTIDLGDGREVADCANASVNSPVITFSFDNETAPGIYETSDYCLNILGNSPEALLFQSENLKFAIMAYGN